MIDALIIRQLIWAASIIYLRINQLSIIHKNMAKVRKIVKLSQYLVQTDKSAALIMSISKCKILKNNSTVLEVQEHQDLCLELGNHRLIVDMDFNLLD